MIATEWNPRCKPPWDLDGSQGLQRKIEKALDGTHPYGSERGHWAKTLGPKGRYFKCTDYGNAERLVADHGGDLRYCADRRRWYQWDGKCWAPDDTGEIERRAKTTVRSIYAIADAIEKEISGDEEASESKEKKSKGVADHLRAWARESESRGKLDAMVDLAKTEMSIPVRLSELDADPWLFNVQNGTIDLRTGSRRDHRREDLIAKISPVVYDPDARSGLWDRFLETATGGDHDLAGYLQRATGYTLQGSPTEKAFLFLYGPPISVRISNLSAAMTTHDRG